MIIFLIFVFQSPTYEDMLLLSSILGPAKAPVASREEVASAPGVFRISTGAGTMMDPWIAINSHTGEQLMVESSDRCLICLSEYQGQEDLRQLHQCRHLYHQECIDQVSRSTFLLLGMG